VPITTAEQLAAFQNKVRTAVLIDSPRALKVLTESRAKYDQTLVRYHRRAHEVILCTQSERAPSQASPVEATPRSRTYWATFVTTFSLHVPDSSITRRANDILDHKIDNIPSPNLLAIVRNELHKDILVFTDHLTPANFGPKPNVRPKLKPGHLLYKVPPVMKFRHTYPCIIRITHQLDQALNGYSAVSSRSIFTA
jgi:hypothetical protein